MTGLNPGVPMKFSTQDVASNKQEQETLALLKLLVLGQREVDEGRTRPAASAIKKLRLRIASRSAAKD